MLTTATGLNIKQNFICRAGNLLQESSGFCLIRHFCSSCIMEMSRHSVLSQRFAQKKLFYLSSLILVTSQLCVRLYPSLVKSKLKMLPWHWCVVVSSGFHIRTHCREEYSWRGTEPMCIWDAPPGRWPIERWSTQWCNDADFDLFIEIWPTQNCISFELYRIWLFQIRP